MHSLNSRGLCGENTQLQWWARGVVALLACWSVGVLAHGVSGGDQGFLEASSGTQLIPFLYLGAKHMVTGYDHLLFLLGVIFFLYRARDVALYVTLFSIGHSATLLFGVLSGAHVNPYLVDAIIGLSVVYKGFDNIGGFRTCFGFQPSARAAVLLFGLVHGFGLATKLQDLSLSPDGLVPNMLAFNVGVELGQLLALGVILIVMTSWRQSSRFTRQAFAANLVLICAGFLLAGYQMAGFMLTN
ncbi:HupE/UreJ family protein [bacterium]|nr:HupE/UreJ family protein [bacterium]